MARGANCSGPSVGQVFADATCSLSPAGGGGCLGVRELCRCGCGPHLVPVAALVQVNVGILIAVTRVISQISADNYKIHGDPSAFK